MEKKESLKPEGEFKLKKTGISEKISGFSGKAFNIVKFILGICLLPFVYAVTVNFLNEFSLIDKAAQNYFWSGIITFLVIYLFIWEPLVIYLRGQKILEVIFIFFKPLVKVAPHLVPIYTIILFIVYQLLRRVINSPWVVRYTVFLLGCTIILHLVFSAKSLRANKSDFLKANYIFGFSFIYTVNITLLAFFLNFIFKEFSFVNFSNTSYQASSNMLYGIFKQAFLR